MINSTKDLSKKPKLISAGVTILLLLAAILNNEKDISNILFKVSLVTLGVMLAHVTDIILHPQLDEDSIADTIENGTDAEKDRAVRLVQAAMIRKALITVAVVLGLTLGL